MKKYKWTLLITSVITLLPVLLGLIFRNHLPEILPIHFGLDGRADAYIDSVAAFLLISPILFVFHWICILSTLKDKRNRAQNPKVIRMVLWIIPTITLFISGLYVFMAFEKYDSIGCWAFLLMGLAFILIGNYLPKCQRNYTIGIKIKWTLESEENWNKTHRFAGKMWVIGGIAMLFGAFLPEKAIIYALLPFIFIMVFPPFLYSWLYYKKQLKDGSYDKEIEKLTAPSKTAIAAVSVFMILVIGFAMFLMFTGDIDFICSEEALQIKASYSGDLSLPYDEIEDIQLIEDFNGGSRIFGFASARLLMGTFGTDELGKYTRYTYKRCDTCVKIDTKNGIVVIGGKDEAASRSIYETLLEKTGLGEKADESN
ncbi:MAG: SdpI family protein [Clostridia bacterium]|nr:SdpI family protein [Clostridia bacterium]